jgi:hypothetical protein
MKLKYSQVRSGTTAANNGLPENYKSTEWQLIVTIVVKKINAGTQASADFFNNGLPDYHSARVSRQTVWKWANGLVRISDARLRVWKCSVRIDDTRHILAITIQRYRETVAEQDSQWQ